ncbi:YciI family protein [Hahella sp. NBU794]|uniref:YciI family protein n=1 Tax=Hahella sp. NBU794 TaxID=3422590 RepID=UPI003D6FCF4D
MKFLCMAYYNVQKFAELSEAEMQAIVSQCSEYDQNLRRSGAVLAQGSLASPPSSLCIRPSKNGPIVSDGPFLETKEQIGGFFMIEASSLEEAKELALKHPAANIGEEMGWGVEIRPIDNFITL